MVDCASSIRKKVRSVGELAGELEMTEILSTIVAQKFVVVLLSENQLHFIEIFAGLSLLFTGRILQWRNWFIIFGFALLFGMLTNERHMKNLR